MTDDNPTAIVPIRRKEPGWVGHRDEEWVICPWCFHRHGDGWEWAREPTEMRSAGKINEPIAKFAPPRLARMIRLALDDLEKDAGLRAG